jgi:hypothetical protein
MMKSRWSKAVLVALLCMTAPMAFADTVNMWISVGSSRLVEHGVYVSPYVGNITAINGVPQSATLPVICLDYRRTTYTGQNNGYVYDRTFNSGPEIYGAIPASEGMYDLAARLGHRLLYTPNLSNLDRAGYSWAIWRIFDTTAYMRPSSSSLAIDSNIRNRAEEFLAWAGSQTWTPNFQVFTPIDGSNSQRMMTVSVPEGSAAGMLGICLFGLFGLVLTLRRRAEQQ